MTSERENGNDVQSLIDQLLQGVKSIDKEDLVRLAKLHGLCEALTTATGPEAEQPNPPVFESASSLVHDLEALVLGEAKDPDATVASIIEAIAALGEPGAGPPSEAEGASAKHAPSDDEVAAKLAMVFEDENIPSETSSTEHDTGVVSEPPYEPVPLKIDKKEEEFVRAFIEEAGEHIEAIEAALLEVERAPEDSEQIDTLFRPFHTIKGMAGFLNLRDVNCLAHEVETVLDQGRKGKRIITPGLIDLVFDVVDILKIQISSINTWLNDPQDDTIPQPPVVDMIGYLRDVVAGRVEPESRGAGTGSAAQKVGENLVEQGACPKEAVDFALDKQQSDAAGEKTGEILVDMGAATPKQVSQALRPQGQAKAGAASQTSTGVVGDQSVRIDTAKLDALVDMVGELVIAQTQVAANPVVASDPKLTKDTDRVAKIVRDVQEVAMGMRMIPIGGTFQKMARLVRDVSRKAGKQVELVITGEDTELDKNVIQQINDPLVHMVRNAVDHGIEPPEGRRASGKNELGRVHLGAFHHGGNIIIEISDDGKGIDPKALIAKGIDKGIVQPGEEITDQQAFQLIFAPGFSMAAQITDISGRGVGMDVVRRNIEQLRGRVEITSELGKGSTFSIRLPLTLAIIDGMVVRVGSERFIIQTIVIEQSLRPQPDQITTVQRKGEVLNVRGRLIPLVQLGSLFGLTGRINPCKAMVVIAHYEGDQIGIIIEELIGQQQVVIKSLGEKFERLRGIAGAAILGDGRVGLILEMSGLVAAYNTSHIPLECSTTLDDVAPADREPSSADAVPTSDTPARDEAVLVPA
ncbi:MAG: chemotaxis protein CheA [Phycisphaerae bacterium]